MRCVLLIVLSFQVATILPVVRGSQGQRPGRAAPEIPRSMTLVLPGIVLGPEPKLVGVTCHASPSLLTGVVHLQHAAALGVVVHLKGLLPQCDQVVVYVNDTRVGGGMAPGCEWALPLPDAAIRNRSGLLTVWVYRHGEGTYRLTPHPLP